MSLYSQLELPWHTPAAAGIIIFNNPKTFVMKKKTLLTLAVLVMMFTVLSCRKIIVSNHDPRPLGLDTICRIETFNVTGYYGNADQYHAYYNAAGYPDSLTDNNPVDGIGVPRFFFKYDSSNRLSDFISTEQPYASEGGFFAIIWHRYTYLPTGLISDTTYTYAGDMRNPGPTNVNDISSIRSYELDGQGRIFRIGTTWEYGEVHDPALISTINYDVNGNVPLSDTSLTYDHKVNFFQTNKVWQFVFVDYSRNNVIKKDTSFVPVYNEFGLPLHLQNLNYGPSPFGNIWNTGLSLDISYACSAPLGPVNY